MKIIYLISFIIVLFGNAEAQQPLCSNVIIDNSDKIQIDFFNNTSDTTGMGIIIRDTSQIFYYTTKLGNNKSINIGKSTLDLKKIRELLTVEFLNKIKNCCREINCPPSIRHGYSFCVKKGDDISDAALDIKYISLDKCGDNQLFEIINLLDKIKFNYR